MQIKCAAPSELSNRKKNRIVLATLLACGWKRAAHVRWLRHKRFIKYEKVDVVAIYRWSNWENTHCSIKYADASEGWLIWMNEILLRFMSCSERECIHHWRCYRIGFPLLRFSFLLFCLIRTMSVRTENTRNSLRSLVPISISMMNLFVVDKQYQFALHRIWPRAHFEITFTESKNGFDLFGVVFTCLTFSLPIYHYIQLISLITDTTPIWPRMRIAISFKMTNVRDFPVHQINLISNHFFALVLGKSSIVFLNLFTLWSRTHWIEYFSIGIQRKSAWSQNYFTVRSIDIDDKLK